jgi:rhodanese-related sulfurtransferase
MVGAMTPAEFLAARALDPALVLLDVREPWEMQVAGVPVEHLQIPMGRIPECLSQLDPARTTVVICRSGARSMEVARYLERQGFQSVHNLTGGILAWSREVDPRIPSY